MELRIGCSSWTSDAWWDRVYPTSIKDGDRLAWYARIFDTVEVDTTYYRPPSDYLVRRWASTTPPGFLFAMKFPRDLIDPKQAVDREKIESFHASARLLGPKLGPILLQFPPWVKPGRASRFLTEILSTLDPHLRYAVELRDAGWFRGTVWDTLSSQLRDRAIALAWSYLTYVEVPAELTTDFVYLRFIGDHTTVPDTTHGEIRVNRSAETRKWADRVRAVTDRVRSTFGYFNNHYEGFAPESVNVFRQHMGLQRVDWASAITQRRLDTDSELR